MPDDPLRVSQAARELGISTREVLVLIRDGAIRHVMVEGIAHVPADAVEDFRERAS